MPDFKVRFLGDLGNAAQFYGTIKNLNGESARQMEAANRTVASSVGKIQGIFNPKTSGAGLFVQNPKTIVDSFNNTFRQTGDVVHRALSGYKSEFDKTAGQYVIKPIYDDQFVKSFDQAIGNYQEYLRSAQRAAPTERKIAAQQLAATEKRVQLLNQALVIEHQIAGYKGAITEAFKNPDPTLNSGRIKSYDQYLKSQRQILDLEAGSAVYAPRQVGHFTPGVYETNVIQNQLRQRQQDLKDALNPPSGATAPASASVIAGFQKEIADLQKILTLAPQNIGAGKAVLTRDLADYAQAATQGTAGLTKAISTLEKQQAKLELQADRVVQKAAQRAAILRNQNPAYAAVGRATTGVPPLDTNLAAAIKQSKDLKNLLLQGGLGAGARFGTNDFLKNVARQEAAVTRFTKNFRTGVYTVQGSLKNLDTNIVEEFTADIDKNGKVVGRWGGQLSGAGAILKQTVRDFQKVIEWTIATTAVFGTLGLAIKSLSTINDLNESLTRFSITAQLSASDTADLFSSLGQVAIQTATPLTDLIKVADDIALATKRAGDSTDEWKQKIVDLTQAVGIFTNLTGEETVQGADKLSSAFKQLDIQPQQLVGVLSKVTAVAGGQSTAINEIVTALGGVSEAARAAQLSIDEQIAAVQVLGQVTNKSAADVATAFKNLFGSISSPGSEKILKEFNIQIRDGAGNLRPFLQIYREVQQAIEQGIIPKGRVQDVLRGISGGPRRAPDAAALLGNLNAVDAAIAKSRGATNEALVANAKILDTNKAKIQQLQNAFDIALFERFGKVVKDVTESVTNLLTDVLKVFNSINPTVLTLLGYMAAMLVSGKLLGTTFKAMGGFGLSAFTGIKRSISDALFGAKSLTAEIAKQGLIQQGLIKQNAAGQLTNAATGRFISPTLNKGQLAQGLLGGNPVKNVAGGTVNYLRNLPKSRQAALLGIGVAGLTAADAAAAGNLQKVDPQVIGSFLALAGSVSLATGVFAPLGAAALLAGTALTFLGGQAEDTKKSAAESAQEIYQLTQNLKDQQSNVKLYTQNQKDAKDSLDAIISSGKQDADTKLAQKAATDNFVEATLNLADANRQVSDTMDSIIDKIPGLSAAYGTFKENIKSGIISGDDLKRLQQQLAKEILQGSGQGVYSTTSLNDTSISSQYRAPTGAGTSPIVANAPGGSNIDLRDLVDNPSLLSKLFSPTGGTTSDVFNALNNNSKNLAYVQSALEQLPQLVADKKIDLNEEQLQKLVDAVNTFAQSASSYTSNQIALIQQQATIQAKGTLGIFSQDQTTAALFANQLAQALNDAIGQLSDRTYAGRDEPAYAPDPRLLAAQKEVASLSQQANVGAPINTTELVKTTRLLLDLKGTLREVGAEGEQAINIAIYKSLQRANLSAEELDKVAKFLGLDFKEAALASEEVLKAFEDASQNARQAFANRSLQLEIAQNEGQYKDNGAGLERLKKQNQQAYESTIALFNGIRSLSQTGLGELNNALAQTTGNFGAFLTTSQLSTITQEDLTKAVLGATTQMYENAVAAGVNAEGLRKVQADAAKLIGIVEAIPDYKQIIIDIKTRMTGAGILYPFSSVQQQISDAQKADKQTGLNVNKIIKDINRIIASAVGPTRLGGTSKTGGTSSAAGSGLDVSEIDLPTEIANASNRSALIQEAIKRARALQHTIPGADKEAKNDIVSILKGTQNLLKVRGVRDDLLRKALEELADVEKKRLDFETKADTIRRIRIGAGDFSAIANVPLNTKTGVSLGSPSGPINVTLNINGTVLSPAQLSQFADLVASALKRQIANG